MAHYLLALIFGEVNIPLIKHPHMEPPSTGECNFILILRDTILCFLECSPVGVCSAMTLIWSAYSLDYRVLQHGQSLGQM